MIKVAHFSTSLLHYSCYDNLTITILHLHLRLPHYTNYNLTLTHHRNLLLLNLIDIRVFLCRNLFVFVVFLHLQYHLSSSLHLHVYNSTFHTFSHFRFRLLFFALYCLSFYGGMCGDLPGILILKIEPKYQIGKDEQLMTSALFRFIHIIFCRLRLSGQGYDLENYHTNEDKP